MVLQDGNVAVTLLNYGAITRSWTIGGVPMVRQLSQDADYLTDPHFTGIIAGRVANRTANGRFTLNGRPHQLSLNDGPHHLHGGPRGLGKSLWQMEPDGPQALRLSYHSPDGEEGYPGAVDFTVDIRLAGHTLSYDMQAMPERPTPINLAQHSYYTLGGTGPIWGARLQLAAARYTPASADGIPRGEIATVSGTALDFQAPRALGPADAALDTNLLFTPTHGPMARLWANGYRLRMWSDQAGVQLYAGAHLPRPNTALCIEPQAPPNALNALNAQGFASIIATPEQPYRQQLQVEIRRDS